MFLLCFKQCILVISTGWPGHSVHDGAVDETEENGNYRFVTTLFTA